MQDGQPKRLGGLEEGNMPQVVALVRSSRKQMGCTAMERFAGFEGLRHLVDKNPKTKHGAGTWHSMLRFDDGRALPIPPFWRTSVENRSHSLE